MFFTSAASCIVSVCRFGDERLGDVALPDDDDDDDDDAVTAWTDDDDADTTLVDFTVVYDVVVTRALFDDTTSTWWLDCDARATGELTARAGVGAGAADAALAIIAFRSILVEVEAAETTAASGSLPDPATATAPRTASLVPPAPTPPLTCAGEARAGITAPPGSTDTGLPPATREPEADTPLGLPALAGVPALTLCAGTTAGTLTAAALSLLVPAMMRFSFSSRASAGRAFFRPPAGASIDHEEMGGNASAAASSARFFSSASAAAALLEVRADTGSASLLARLPSFPSTRRAEDMAPSGGKRR